MFDSLVQSIENVFVQPSFKRFLYFVFVITVVLSGALYVDRSTGYSIYTKAEKRITALERLQALEEKHIEQSPSLGPIYATLVEELKQPAQDPFPVHVSFSGDPLIKFFAATFISLIFLVVATVQLIRGNKDSKWVSTLVGTVILSVVLGVPALIIPSWINPWVNAAIYLFAQSLFYAFIATFGTRTLQSSKDS